MLRFTSFACAVLLPLAISGCPSTSCEAGTVLSGGACVPADGGSDTCARSYYADDDMDGHGDPDDSVSACAPPDGYVAAGDDCDDTTAMRAPGRTETCDGLDNDCDDAVDQTFACAQGATVTCTTTCGSSGTATCASDCSVPTTCTPPPETCSGVDDDCDGRVDEGVLTVGPRQDLGTTSVTAAGVVVVPTRAGFAVFRENDSGSLVARQLDASGVPTGSLVTVAALPMTSFDAYWTGTEILVAFLAQVADERITLVRYADDFTMPYSGSLAADGRRRPVRVTVGDGWGVVAVNDLNLEADAVRFGFPGLADGLRTDAANNSPVGDLITDARSRAYLAFSTPTNIAMMQLPSAGPLVSTLAFYASASVRGAPAAAFADVHGEPTAFLAVPESSTGPGTIISGRVLTQAGDGTLSARTTGPLRSDLDPTRPVTDMSVTHALGRFFVAAIVTDAAGATSWVVLEVAESSDGATLEVTSHTIEATTDAAHVSIAARPDGAMVTAGATNGGPVRSYLLGCP